MAASDQLLCSTEFALELQCGVSPAWHAIGGGWGAPLGPDPEVWGTVTCCDTCSTTDRAFGFLEPQSRTASCASSTRVSSG